MHTVLILTQDLEAWGAQRQAVELARGLATNGHDVRVGVLRSGGPLATALREAGVPIVEFRRCWRWDLSPIGRLATYLRRERVEVLHSLLFLPNFYARLAGWRARTPAVISSLRSTAIEGWHRYALEILMTPWCDAVVSNSEAGRRSYARFPTSSQQIVVIRNGVRMPPSDRDPEVTARLRNAWGLGRYRHVIATVGGMAPRRLGDYKLLLRAIPALLEKHPGTGVVFVGDGPLRDKVNAEVARLGLQRNVVFAGWLPDPHRAYPLFDVYVQPSASAEGISNSILEAMTHGVPVVATDVGGNNEVVLDGLTGYLVPPRDTGCLAEAISRLLADPAARQAMGARGAQRVRSAFGIERLVQETSDLYDRILNSSGVRDLRPRGLAPGPRQAWSRSPAARRVTSDTEAGGSLRHEERY